MAHTTMRRDNGMAWYESYAKRYLLIADHWSMDHLLRFGRKYQLRSMRVSESRFGHHWLDHHIGTRDWRGLYHALHEFRCSIVLYWLRIIIRWCSFYIFQWQAFRYYIVNPQSSHPQRSHLCRHFRWMCGCHWLVLVLPCHVHYSYWAAFVRPNGTILIRALKNRPSWRISLAFRIRCGLPLVLCFSRDRK